MLLLFFAGIAWTKLRGWRRMESLREPVDARATRLARGQHAEVAKGAQGAPSFPERLSALLIGLALATIPYWQGMPLPEAWVALGFATILIMRAMLPRR